MTFPSTAASVGAHVCHTHLYPHLSNFYLALPGPPATWLSTSCSGSRSEQHWSQQNIHLATLMPWSHKHSHSTPCGASFFYGSAHHACTFAIWPRTSSVAANSAVLSNPLKLTTHFTHKYRYASLRLCCTHSRKHFQTEQAEEMKEVL